ncbi:MAG: hypothetical protein AB1714_01345 [Acidobacteriota bacterium]
MNVNGSSRYAPFRCHRAIGIHLGRLIALLLLLAPALSAAGESQTGSPFMRGVALGLFSQDRSYNYEREIDQIKALNANYISLVVNMVQDNVKSEGVYRPESAPSDETIARVAAVAHSRGLSVFLFPIIYVVDVRPGKWRGTIDPPSWDRWFESYNRILFDYADLAQKHGIELLLVGCEQISSEKRNDLWLKLIAGIRQRYHGKLIYSSNWDRLSKESFLDKLDYLGSNAYFELARSNHPNKQELLYNWKRIQQRYDEWRAKFHKPLVFTEIGYPSADGCSQNPWDYTTNAPVDLEEQALCYEAFFQSWKGIEYLHGAFVYAWWGDGGPLDRSYTPRGKPAEAVLKEWFLHRFP